MQKTSSFTIKPRPFAASPVDIIIPFHGQYQKTMACVRSVLESTRGNPYRITLVDDGSPNGEFVDILKGLRNVQGLKNDKQQGFGAALKLGFDNTSHPWVVFLNSDCIINEAGWLVELGDCLLKLKTQKVRMVAARSNNPGSGLHPALTADRNLPIDDVILREEHLPLYCTMCHRDLFKHIGGFVKQYPLGYEDEELAYRMRKYGYRQAVCGTSWVSHHGGATLNEIYKTNKNKYEEMAETSRQMCMADIQKLLAK